ncbi:TIGR00730 family Rossman fold protein [Corynebacterium hindlerae]|uniref:TIGR00730 family Rossman fold protein n=1 Tax=Corynebacterium hindlerae TaxID=699041 RepID=UPI001E3FD7B9|nr:TIGR00730 family Rossman fold protein [Corynebacterium hindlerae]
MTCISVSAVILHDEAGRVLTVRKQGTDLYMFPGGKPEPGETFEEAALREAFEELGAHITDIHPFGTFTAPAANEADTHIAAEVFTALLLESPAPCNEIAEIAWVQPQEPHVALAPLLADHVFPALPDPVTSVTVFCGSALGNSPAFASSASALGQALADHGLELVYGGGKIGLMGTIADTVIAAGGRASGIIPTGLADKELAHPGLAHLEVVNTMHERKARMAELGDAFVAMPGGAGTLEELFEAWVWQILGIHHKPVALYGRDFWAPLLDMLARMRDQGFIATSFVDALIVADTPEELLKRIHTWTPPRAKWS